MFRILLFSSKLMELISNFDRSAKTYFNLRRKNPEEYNDIHNNTTLESIVGSLLRSMNIKEKCAVERKAGIIDDFESSSGLYLKNPIHNSYTEATEERLFGLEVVYSLLSGSSRFPFGLFAFSENFIEFYMHFFRTQYENLANKQDKIELSMLKIVDDEFL